jgi:tRNA nucleotidyltransferase (CCA-adding enzyme)
MSPKRRDLSGAIRANLVPGAVEAACKAALLAESAGMRIFIVGGTVRDMLMGCSGKDIDMAVEGDAISIGKALAGCLGAELKCYRRFGTCTLAFPCSMDGNENPGPSVITMDLATAREETYAYPGALPEVRASTIDADIARRDFTINAMAVSMNEENIGDLTDNFGGEEDIDKRMIRVLHEKSFLDDPSRIFRAVRFEQRFSFTVEGRTEALIRSSVNAGMIRRMEKNRIKEEWRLVLGENKPKECLCRLEDLLGEEMGFVRDVVAAREVDLDG